MKIDNKQNPQDTKSLHEVSVAQQWIDQHCSLERYILQLFITFNLLHRFHINRQSRLGKSITFLFMLFVFFGLPLAVTAIFDQWDSAPLVAWAVIAIIFGLVGNLYDLYYRIGLNVCSIGYTVTNKDFFLRQIKWDRFWFNLHTGVTAGVVISLSMLVSLVYIDQQTTGMDIPAGSLLVICLLAFQIGELACHNLLMCFEIRNFSGVEHTLFRFNPLKTATLQKAMIGYNQFGLTTSLLMTAFIACSAILLPNSAYLTNPVWLFLVFSVYTIVILAIILPRYFIEQIIRRSKQSQLEPLRQKLNGMFDQLMNLNDEEYSEMLRLVNIQDMISNAPELSPPISTIGRLFGTLIIPTLTFILAALGEAYISNLFQQVFN
jgi:hypothetical protein